MSKYKFRWSIAFCVIVSICLQGNSVHGQAFCALRDPATMIYEFYPDATTYKSIVRTVDNQVREYVGSKLPFSIHFNELGKHSLYVPIKDSKPLGVVHARSEAGNHGLTEIVWSLTPNLEVKDFAFQRCRSRARSAVESDDFKKQIIGMRFNDLKNLLSQDGQSLAHGKLKPKYQSMPIATTVVRSALKTISVSKSAWRRDLAVLQPLYNAHQAFPNAVQVRKIERPYGDRVVAEFNRRYVTPSGNLGSGINRDEVMALQAIDSAGLNLGFVVKTAWGMGQQNVTMWWTVSNTGEIKDVHADGGWPDAMTEKAFRDVIGFKKDSLSKCSTAAEIAGAEILLLAKYN